MSGCDYNIGFKIIWIKLTFCFCLINNVSKGITARRMTSSQAGSELSNGAQQCSNKGYVTLGLR